MESGRVRVQLRVSLGAESASFARFFAGDELLTTVLRWIGEVGYEEAAAGVESGDMELVDETLVETRVLAAPWSRTLVAAGLWPSAVLGLRRCCIELTIKTVDGEEAVVSVRPDERCVDVVVRAFAALPPRALPGVKSANAHACRLVVAGRVLDRDRTLEDEGISTGDLVVLCRPIAAAPCAACAPETVAPEVGTCRICFQEDVVRPSRARPPPTLSWGEQLELLSRDPRAFLARLAAPSRDVQDQLITPCRCTGTMRFVHVRCLDRWRQAAPTERSRFRCDQCGASYALHRTNIAAFLSSDLGALSVAGALLSLLVCGAGSLLHKQLPTAWQLQLYRSLRVQPSHRLAEIGVLGLAFIGFTCFAVYVLDSLFAVSVHVHLGLDWRLATHHLAFLGIWIASELVEVKRTRAFAVVGVLIAANIVFAVTLRCARKIAHFLGDTVLDVRHLSPLAPVAVQPDDAGS